MTTQIDWQRELDASFGSGEEVPVGHYVAAGHTAVRLYFPYAVMHRHLEVPHIA